MNEQEIKDRLSILNLSDNLNEEDLKKFYDKVIPNLMKYNVEVKVKPFYDFAKSLGLSDLEIINFIRINVQVLTDIGFKAFVKKYIFLSVIENENNTQRIRHMKKTPKDFKITLDKLYSKYCYMKEKGVEINWSTLVRQKDDKLIKKIKNSGETPLNIESIKTIYPLDKEYIESLRKLAINNFEVRFDGEKRRSK